MSDRLVPILFVGGSRATPVEALVAEAQEAAARDLIERLAASPDYSRPLIATSSPSFARSIANGPGEIIFDDGDFHFGRALADIVRRFGVRHALYLGGGSAPLLGVADLTSIAGLLARDERCLIANNFFSADFVAFTPAEAIAEIDPPRIDNDLAYRLQRQGSFRNIPLARTAATQLDLDTPTDLAVAAVHPGIGHHLRSYLDGVDLDLDRLRAVCRHLTDPTSEVIVSGRVGSHLMNVLETELACRTRVFSEERGMRASGRETRGEVRSLLGFHYAAVGARHFFDDLAQLGNAAFVDTRVLFNQLAPTATASDRFNSDLLRPALIANSLLREFTEAAAHARLPVVLGGHSLVSGGLWALAEAGWLERDRERAGTSG